MNPRSPALRQDGKKQSGILSAFRELTRKPSRTSNTDGQVRTWWHLGPPPEPRPLKPDKLGPMSAAIPERFCDARSLPALGRARPFVGTCRP